MKELTLVASALLFSAAPAFAQTVLGVPEGVYDGAGPMQLLPGIQMVIPQIVIPNISFTSHRELRDDTVTAVSTAYFSPSILDNIPGLGPWLTEKTKITISAHLKLVPAPDGSGQLELQDLDHGGTVVGRAICFTESCSFHAKIMGGKFELAETWVRTEHGFNLESGSQNFNGIEAFYSGDFYSTSSSFNEIHRMVFAKPLADLPVRHGIDAKQVVEALLSGVGEISDRSAATFASHADFRPARDKLLHPVGVCADVKWSITERSQATGLFSRGSKVPGIIRFSTGTAESAYNKDGRIFGFALKLFPTQNPDENVETVNFQTLDTYGFDRSTRKRFFHEDQSSDGVSTPVQFTNVAPARSAFGQTLAKFFDRFDQPNFARPVYMAAEVNDTNRTVREPASPYEIRFVPHFKPRSEPADRLQTEDFRTEIQSYEPGQIKFDILIVSMEPSDGSKNLNTLPHTKKIGTLTVGSSVVSDACDWNLHFNHPKSRLIPAESVE